MIIFNDVLRSVTCMRKFGVGLSLTDGGEMIIKDRRVNRSNCDKLCDISNAFVEYLHITMFYTFLFIIYNSI